MFVGTSGSPAPVTLHQYLAELVGAGVVEALPCGDQTPADISAQIDTDANTYTIDKVGNNWCCNLDAVTVCSARTNTFILGLH